MVTRPGSDCCCFFVFTLAVFLGFELIAKVPSQLHTPLMPGPTPSPASRSSARLLALERRMNPPVAKWLGFAAVVLATINVVGGYVVTDRMLAMFKKKDSAKTSNGTLMNAEILINSVYIVASILFIFGIKMLGPQTPRAGQRISSRRHADGDGRPPARSGLDYSGSVAGGIALGSIIGICRAPKACR